MTRHILMVSLAASFALAGCGGPQVKAIVPVAPASAPVVVAPPPDPGVAHLAALVELAKNGPTQKDYPQADSVVITDDDDVTLQADGTLVEHHHHVIRILDPQRGKERFADVHIGYDGKRQALTVNLARTVNPDGQVHVTSGDEIADIVPPELADATIYSGVLERVVSFPAVDKGSVIELDYTRVTHAGPDSAMGDELALADWDPMLSRRVTLTVPAGQTVHYVVVGTTIEPTEIVDAGVRTLIFAAKDLPLHETEPGAPPPEAVLPRLVFSLLPDWVTAGQRVARQLVTDAPTTPEIAAVAAQLTAGATSEEKRAQAIYRFVAHDIRSVELPLGLVGWTPSSPETILANRYGDERDKVTLFLALCKAGDVHALAVLVRTGGVPVIEAVPSVTQFNRLLAVVDLRGGRVWLDLSDEIGSWDSGFAGEGNLALTLFPSGATLERRPLVDAKSSLGSVKETLVLNDKGDLDARYQYAVTGYYAHEAVNELHTLQGENLARFFASAAGNVSASALDVSHAVGDLTAVEGTIALSQRVSAPGYSVAQDAGEGRGKKFRVVELPSVTLPFLGIGPGTYLSTRTLPLWLDTPRTLQKDLTLTIPRGWKLAYVPADIAANVAGLSYTMACRAKGPVLTCHTEITTTALEVQPESYAEFRAAANRFADYKQHMVLLTQ